MRNAMDESQFSQEVRRAEFHLNDERPASRLISWALGGTFVVLFVALATQDAEAASIPVASVSAGASCSTVIKSVQFAGTFKLKSSSDTKTPSGPSLRFVIGQPANGSQGHAIAQIWSGNHCQAVCSSLAFEQSEKDDGSIPISLDLQCRGEELGPLSAHVAVLWGKPGQEDSTLLRFGSWVEGYEQAAMKVEIDHFNTPAGSYSNPVTVASRTDF